MQTSEKDSTVLKGLYSNERSLVISAFLGDLRGYLGLSEEKRILTEQQKRGIKQAKLVFLLAKAGQASSAAARLQAFSEAEHLSPDSEND